MDKSVDQLLASLNALKVGDLDSIGVRLSEARQACEGLGQPELAASLNEADDALAAGDVRLFRKRVQHVVARLGHLR